MLLVGLLPVLALVAGFVVVGLTQPDLERSVAPKVVGITIAVIVLSYIGVL